MIRSMTGFGSAKMETEGGAIGIEVRSVNSRHLRLSLRMPPGTEEWEGRLRERVSRHVSRGQVNLNLELEPAAGDSSGFELNRRRVEAYLDAFRALREEYALPGQVDLPLLVRTGDLLRQRRETEWDWVDVDDLESVTDRALEELIRMREQEGERLEEDLRAHLDAIRAGIERARTQAPRRLERERERLREAVLEMTGQTDLDEDRLAREVALLADKWDVGEELVRAESHLDAFDELLQAPPEEGVGKRLKFLSQELLREVNTLGAKANDAEISREVVEMKNHLESLREQIENVE